MECKSKGLDIRREMQGIDLWIWGRIVGSLDCCRSWEKQRGVWKSGGAPSCQTLLTIPPSDSVSNIQICALDNIKGPLIAFFDIQRKIQTATEQEIKVAGKFPPENFHTFSWKTLFIGRYPAFSQYLKMLSVLFSSKPKLPGIHVKIFSYFNLYG